ncbi:hypothetical protein BpHYR1_043578 [Brachionus plicatilis]|uniref:Uncharacterized protein n=1 Tax=Brachionus plicatilis TaxID=10195 RepID=A0A3M7SN52_BRAPC|nr:hypothetical protein BpHYR1_043578 [Brachionus plicatilis]
MNTLHKKCKTNEELIFLVRNYIFSNKNGLTTCDTKHSNLLLESKGSLNFELFPADWDADRLEFEIFFFILQIFLNSKLGLDFSIESLEKSIKFSLLAFFLGELTQFGVETRGEFGMVSFGHPFITERTFEICETAFPGNKSLQVDSTFSFESRLNLASFIRLTIDKKASRSEKMLLKTKMF